MPRRPVTPGREVEATAGSCRIFLARTVPRRFAREMLPQLSKPEPARLEVHEHVARDRARPDPLDAIVPAQAVTQAESQRGLASKARDAQPGSTPHRGGQDNDAVRVAIGTHRWKRRHILGVAEITRTNVAFLLQDRAGT